MKQDNKLEKISYTPDIVFIDNGNIINKDIPDKINKAWCISLVKDRLGSFISENKFTLFDYLDILNK